MVWHQRKTHGDGLGADGHEARGAPQSRETLQRDSAQSHPPVAETKDLLDLLNCLERGDCQSFSLVLLLK